MFWQSFRYRSSLMMAVRAIVLFVKDALVFDLRWLPGAAATGDAECLWYPLVLSACPEVRGRAGLPAASVALGVLPFCAKRSLQEACPGFCVTKLFPAAVLECFLRISTEKSINGSFLGGFWWFLR